MSLLCVTSSTHFLWQESKVGKGHSRNVFYWTWCRSMGRYPRRLFPRSLKISVKRHVYIARSGEWRSSSHQWWRSRLCKWQVLTCESIKDRSKLFETVMAGAAFSEVKWDFRKKRGLVVVLLPQGICGAVKGARLPWDQWASFPKTDAWMTASQV